MPAATSTATAEGGRDRTPANKGRRYPAEILTPEEVRALIRACSAKAPTGIRNRALIVTLYRGGLRLAEALSLYPKDVDPARGNIRVLHGKGDRARTVGLDPGAMAVLERWVAERRKLGITARRRLFCTLAGQPLQPAYVRQLLPRLGAKAGIDKRVHAHGLRHTHAAELAEEGHPSLRCVTVRRGGEPDLSRPIHWPSRPGQRPGADRTRPDPTPQRQQRPRPIGCAGAPSG